jgi:tetratricopeptide (TPR) repeat protein
MTALVGRNELCSCGSGKKFKRCHGASPADGNSTSALTASFDASLQQAMAQLQQGKASQAEKLLAQLINVRPQHPQPHFLLGYAALQANNHGVAATRMRKALDLGLNDPAAHYHYGCALVSLGQHAEAAEAFEKALAGKPDFLPALTNLANCLLEQRDFAKAETHYRLALEADPGNLAACHNLGQVFALTQRVDEAIEYFQRAADVAPGIAELWAALAVVQESNNDLVGSEHSANKALCIEPHSITANTAISRVFRRKARPLEALAALDAGRITSSTPGLAIGYWNERGTVLEKLGHHNEAMQAHTQCKALLAQKRSKPFDMAATLSTLHQERAILTADRSTAWSVRPETTSPINGPAPVFIVGFPRSGTTLLEQMLGCHSAIAPCGELGTCLEREAGGGSYPQNLLDIDDDVARASKLLALRHEYFGTLHRHAGEGKRAQYATDKLPLNLMRIGLIRLLLPEARIIHVMRHPLDSVLSAYFTAFLQGNDWSLKLTDTAQMFAESWQQAQIMRQLPGMKFMTVRYEDLVSDAEQHLREVLNFLDLAWEPECLAFHQSKRVARTASYAQVNRPLYQTSKNRYRPYLKYFDAQTLAILQPAIDHYGYTVEGLPALDETTA